MLTVVDTSPHFFRNTQFKLILQLKLSILNCSKNVHKKYVFYISGCGEYLKAKTSLQGNRNRHWRNNICYILMFCTGDQKGDG